MLNENQKKIIREEYKHKSVRNIAKSLKVPRDEVEAYLAEIPKPRNKFIVPALVSLLLIFHIFIRHNTFWLSHVAGDQGQYAGLAMKLEKSGLTGYNLRGIDYAPFDKEGNIIKIVPSRDPEGGLLRGLKESGAGYYDMPFFYKGPAFPIVIMLSHSIFARGEDYMLARLHLGKSVFNVRPKIFFTKQFYASILPLFFSTVLMLLTFYIGRFLFSDRVGLYAAFMMAVNPITILTSHKLWADDMLSAFVAGAVILFLLAKKKSNVMLSLLGGASAGIAVLTKQNGGVICVAIAAYAIFAKSKGIKELIFFTAGFALLVLPWFYKVFSIYGNPIYQPPRPDLLEKEATGWFRILAGRPHPLVFFPVGIPYLSPIFVFAYGTLIPKQEQDTRDKNSKIALLWVWILAFICFFVFFGGNEHRSMLPTYPAIAVLAALCLDRARTFIKALLQNSVIAELAVFAVLIASAAWSIPIGMKVVLENAALILKPF